MEERIDGITVPLPLEHTNYNIISTNIGLCFRPYWKQLAYFRRSMTVFLTDKDWFLPDGVVICDRSKIKENGVHGVPDLVIEILAPQTARRDRGYKKEVYERCGVPEYWLVSPEAKSVEVYWLCDGHYRLYNLYTKYPDDRLENMPDRENSVLEKEIRCRFGHHFRICPDDIFSDLIDFDKVAGS